MVFMAIQFANQCFVYWLCYKYSEQQTRIVNSRLRSNSVDRPSFVEPSETDVNESFDFEREKITDRHVEDYLVSGVNGAQ